ncbi:phostensin [Sigmodon hispidus]
MHCPSKSQHNIFWTFKEQYSPKAPDSRKRKQQNSGPQHQPLCVPQPRGSPHEPSVLWDEGRTGGGAPRRSGHTFTVNPRRCVPPASPAPPPATPATADAVGSGPGCLVKGSPERHHKQLKISFSETALETTYQYPSERSVLEDLGPEPEALSAPSP